MAIRSAANVYSYNPPSSGSVRAAYVIDRTIGVPNIPPDEPPTIEDISPAPGQSLTKDQAITFNTVDDDAIRKVVIIAKYAVTGWEVIHDGTSFGPQYNQYSTREVFGTGYSYSVRRDLGWPEAPTIDIVALDSAGQEPT